MLRYEPMVELGVAELEQANLPSPPYVTVNRL